MKQPPRSHSNSIQSGRSNKNVETTKFVLPHNIRSQTLQNSSAHRSPTAAGAHASDAFPSMRQSFSALSSSEKPSSLLGSRAASAFVGMQHQTSVPKPVTQFMDDPISVLSLTENELIEFREAYALFDQDNDGCMSIADLNRVMRGLGVESTTKKDLMGMISSVDTDHDGVIDFEQFLNLMVDKLSTTPSVEQEMRETFRVFDKDDNGCISAAELKLVMVNLGEDLTMEEAEEMIAEVDKNDLHEAKFEDFVKIMMSKK